MKWYTGKTKAGIVIHYTVTDEAADRNLEDSGESW